MVKKSNDYQNPKSTVKQADYYPRGIETILDIMHGKILRIRSVADAMTYDPDYVPNFESIEDSGIDIINYAAFLVAYSRGKIPGQVPTKNILNQEIEIHHE